MNTSNLLVIGGAVALVGVYLLDKQKKEKDALVSQIQTQPEPQNNTPPIVESNFYTPVEANKKALEVVTKWIGILDAIPKEALAQETTSVSKFRLDIKKREDLIRDYQKVLEEAKKARKPTFTFENRTFYTENQEDVRNGKFLTVLGKTKWNPSPNRDLYVLNEYNVKPDLTLQKGLESFNSSLIKQGKTLGDYVKGIKSYEYAGTYDNLKLVFTLIPKTDVDRLVVLMPKIFLLDTNYPYLTTQYEKNPLTLEDKLFYRDIDLEGVLSRNRTADRQGKNLISTREQAIMDAVSNYRGAVNQTTYV